MPKVLTDDQIASFKREGYLFPIDGIDKEKCDDLLGAMNRFEDHQGINPGVFKLKGHLCLPETWDLIREPRILDAAEDIIGPNILAFGSRFWVKPAGDGSFVSWHQDSAYFGCDPHDMVTCWLALTPANKGKRLPQGDAGLARGGLRARREPRERPRRGAGREEEHARPRPDHPGARRVEGGPHGARAGPVLDA